MTSDIHGSRGTGRTTPREPEIQRAAMSDADITGALAAARQQAPAPGGARLVEQPADYQAPTSTAEIPVGMDPVSQRAAAMRAQIAANGALLGDLMRRTDNNGRVHADPIAAPPISAHDQMLIDTYGSLEFGQYTEQRHREEREQKLAARNAELEAELAAIRSATHPEPGA